MTPFKYEENGFSISVDIEKTGPEEFFQDTSKGMNPRSARANQVKDGDYIQLDPFYGIERVMDHDHCWTDLGWTYKFHVAWAMPSGEKSSRYAFMHEQEQLVIWDVKE